MYSCDEHRRRRALTAMRLPRMLFAVATIISSFGCATFEPLGSCHIKGVRSANSVDLVVRDENYGNIIDVIVKNKADPEQNFALLVGRKTPFRAHWCRADVGRYDIQVNFEGNFKISTFETMHAIGEVNFVFDFESAPDTWYYLHVFGRGEMVDVSNILAPERTTFPKGSRIGTMWVWLCQLDGKPVAIPGRPDSCEPIASGPLNAASRWEQLFKRADRMEGEQFTPSQTP